MVKKPLREPTLVYRLRTPYLEKQSFVKGGECRAAVRDPTLDPGVSGPRPMWRSEEVDVHSVRGRYA